MSTVNVDVLKNDRLKVLDLDGPPIITREEGKVHLSAVVITHGGKLVPCCGTVELPEAHWGRGHEITEGVRKSNLYECVMNGKLVALVTWTLRCSCGGWGAAGSLEGEVPDA